MLGVGVGWPNLWKTANFEQFLPHLDIHFFLFRFS